MFIYLLVWAGCDPKVKPSSASSPLSVFIPPVIVLILWAIPKSFRVATSIIIITSFSVALIAAMVRCHLFEKQHDFTLLPQDEESAELFDGDTVAPDPGSDSDGTLAVKP